MTSSAPLFHAWLDRFLASYYRHRPVNATFIGYHAHDRRLPDYSRRGVEAALDDMASLASELRALPDEPLSPAERIDRRLAEAFLEIQDWEYRSGWFHRRNPAWYTGEAIFGVFSLMLRDFAPEPERLEAAAARLDEVPRLVDEARVNVSSAPAAFIDRALDECKGAFAFFESELPIVLSRAVPRAARALEDFRSHLEKLERTDERAYACGEEAFSLLLHRGHFLTETADEILEHAEREIARLAPIVADLLPDASTPPPRERYYERYREIWEESRTFALERNLVTWPDCPVDFVPRPAWARRAAPYLYFLHYRSPAPLDGLFRVDYLVPPIDAPPSESVIKLNHVIHHGGIGHHVQNSHAKGAPSRIGRIAAVDCASRIAMFCGGTMAEGWACYATGVMNEAGFLTSEESAAEERAHLRMAARAVVDIKLHLGRMRFEQAERFYIETTGMSATAARSEVTKNAMFPGAAVIYFVGSRAILALREETRRRLGERFDLCAFHDTFLSQGSIPVTLAAELVRDWRG